VTPILSSPASSAIRRVLHHRTDVLMSKEFLGRADIRSGGRSKALRQGTQTATPSFTAVGYFCSNALGKMVEGGGRSFHILLGHYFPVGALLLKIRLVIGKADISSLERSMNALAFSISIPITRFFSSKSRTIPGATSWDSVLTPLNSSM